MSQHHILLPNSEGQMIRAIVGFDPRIGNFFLTVFKDGEEIYTSLSENQDDTGSQIWLGKTLTKYGIALPPEVYNKLETEWSLGGGNDVTEHRRIIPTIIDSVLLRMKAVQLLRGEISFVSGKMPNPLWALLPADDSKHTLIFFSSETIEIGLPPFIIEEFDEETLQNLTDAKLIEMLESVEKKWAEHNLQNQDE